MSAILIYIVKSTFYLTMLYGFFLGVMRKTSFFRLNRWMLVLGTMVCMLLPFYSVSVEETGLVQMPMQSLNHLLKEVPTEVPIPEEVSASLQVIEKENGWQDGIPFFHLLTFIYIVGALCSLVAIHRSISKIQKLIDAFLPTWKDGFWMIVVPERIPSFSWYRYMVISEEDFRHHPSVLVHEEAHLRKEDVA